VTNHDSGGRSSKPTARRYVRYAALPTLLVAAVLVTLGIVFRHHLAWGDAATWFLAGTSLLAFGAAAFAGMIAFDLYKVEAGRDRREAKRAADAATTELVTAATDLLAGVDTIRAAYQGHLSRTMNYVLLTGRIMAAFGIVFGDVDWTEVRGTASGGRIKRAIQTFECIATMRRLGRLLYRLAGIDDNLVDRHRAAALDASTTLTPRVLRLYAAITAAAQLPLGEELEQAASDLVPAVGELLPVVVAGKHKYDRARQAADKALDGLRRAARKPSAR
jgi:hypothetical protein